MSTPADAAYAAWVDGVHTIQGVATAWPFAGSNYGQPAARFPADVFAQFAGQPIPGTSLNMPMAAGVQFNNPGTWVYVLASTMTGGDAVNQSAQAMTQATSAEAEQACAVEGNCPTNFEALVKDIVIGLGIVAGAVVVSKLG